MTRKQWAIIAALALAVVCELCGGVWLVVWDSNQQTTAVVHVPTASPAPPTETPALSPTDGPTPIATFPPTSTPPQPTPTNTRVFTREEINEPTLTGIADEVITRRELQPLAEVDFQLLTVAELKERFAQYYAEEYTPEDIEKMRQAYVTLGLLDEDFDLAATLVDMQAESIAGFYTPDEKKLYIISEYDLVETEQKITFAHEYTHALQDQHFDLARLDVEGNSDRVLAARSLAEGDATLLMAVYAYENVTEAEWKWLAYQSSRLNKEKVETAPQALGIVSIFPYIYGTQFVLGLFLQGGWAAVNQAYSSPPQSTEQVLHLDKYTSRDEPQSVELPDLAAILGEGWEQLDRDVMGELVTLLYLGEQLDAEQAAQAAEGWDGDAYAILRNSQGQRLFAVRTVWDSAAEAQEFSAAFGDYVVKEYGEALARSEDKAQRTWWESPTVSVLLSRHGQETLIVVAPDRGSAEKVLAQLSGF